MSLLVVLGFVSVAIAQNGYFPIRVDDAGWVTSGWDDEYQKLLGLGVNEVMNVNPMWFDSLCVSRANCGIKMTTFDGPQYANQVDSMLWWGYILPIGKPNWAGGWADSLPKPDSIWQNILKRHLSNIRDNYVRPGEWENQAWSGLYLDETNWLVPWTDANWCRVFDTVLVYAHNYWDTLSGVPDCMKGLFVYSMPALAAASGSCGIDFPTLRQKLANTGISVYENDHYVFGYNIPSVYRTNSDSFLMFQQNCLGEYVTGINYCQEYFEKVRLYKTDSVCQNKEIC
jgi:hypothetical protein